MKKHALLVLSLLIIGILLAVNLSKIYLKEDELSADIQRRLKKTKNTITDYEILGQKDIENGRAILYKYSRNNMDMVACTVYKRAYGRFKFATSSGFPANYGTLAVSLKDMEGSIHECFIHFGFFDERYPNKYEITLSNQVIIKEYQNNEFFIETYDLKGEGASVKPIK